MPQAPARDAPEPSEQAARDLLRRGDAELLGRMPWSSNATFLVRLASDAGELAAVYKPRRGERPLWDFPAGSLCDREVAAFEVSEALGWDLVPDTVLRDGPAGEGMMQRFVEHDHDDHYFTLADTHADDFRRMAAFDVVVNNADRKAGHCMRDHHGRIRGVDHGLSFHAQWKLRTVIWEFAADPIPEALEADLRRLAADLAEGPLAARLGGLLAPAESVALRARVEHLLARGALPDPDPGHHSYPWPLV